MHLPSIIIHFKGEINSQKCGQNFFHRVYLPLDSPSMLAYNINMPRLTIEQLYSKVKSGKEDSAASEKPAVIETSFKRSDDKVRADGGLPDVYIPPQKALPPAPTIPYGPLRKLNADRIKDRTSLMEQLNTTIQLTDTDLPSLYYRADLLDWREFKVLEDPEVTPDQTKALLSSLEAASVELKHHEGYPTLLNGQPFWMQMDHEPREAHDAFLTYQTIGGARQLTELEGIAPFAVLIDWFHTYLWGFRVKAFDMFRVVRHQKIKLLRALNIEDDHFLVAEKLFNRIKAHIGSEEFKIEDLSADKLVKVLAEVVKMQRISAGLEMNSGNLSKEILPPKVQSVEMIMRQIAGQQDSEQMSEEDSYDLLSESPEHVAAAQELIIRINSGRG